MLIGILYNTMRHYIEMKYHSMYSVTHCNQFMRNKSYKKMVFIKSNERLFIQRDMIFLYIETFKNLKLLLN